MGEHKLNPTAKLAKEGKLPPKPKKASKREIEAELMRHMYSFCFAKYIDLFIKNSSKY